MSTTTNAVDTQITDLADALTGFHPALDRAVSALADLAAADLTADASQAVVAALGAYDENLSTLVGLVVQRIANPDANAALAGLPDDRRQTLRRLGAEYAATADDATPRDLAAEISAVIDGA